MWNKKFSLSVVIAVLFIVPLFGFLYLFYIDSYNPVKVPISISNVENFKYEFKVPASISYNVGLKFTQKIDFDNINALIRDSALIKSVLLEDGSEIGYPIISHGGYPEYFVIYWGGFDAKRGHKYELEMHFQKSLPHLEKGNPQVIVSPAFNEERGFLLIVLLFWGILFLFLQIILLVIVIKKKAKAIDNAFNL